MEELIKQIKIALDNNLYYLSLQATLSLPDICASLQSKDGKTTGQKYAEWYDNYVGSSSSFVDGKTCYKLRCSSLHEGNTQHKQLGYSRIIFIEPNEFYNFHNNIINDALNLNIKLFCTSILDAVEKWFEIIQYDDNFTNNYKKFMKRYENGLHPYISGIPVIS